MPEMTGLDQRQEASSGELRLSNADKKKITALQAAIAIFIASLPIILMVGSTIHGTNQREFNAIATATAYYQNPEAEINRENELHENVGMGYVYYEMYYPSIDKMGVCQGDIFGIKPDGTGSLILATTALHCLSEDEIDNIQVTLKDFNRVVHPEDYVPANKDKSSVAKIKKIIPFGRDGVAMILRSELNPEELFREGIMGVDEASLLCTPSGSNRLQMFAFTGPDLNIPSGVDTTRIMLPGELGFLSSINSVPGTSGAGGFDPENGAFLGILTNGIMSSANSEMWVEIDPAERQQIAQAWHTYPPTP